MTCWLRSRRRIWFGLDGGSKKVLSCVSQINYSLAGDDSWNVMGREGKINAEVERRRPGQNSKSTEEAEYARQFHDI